jgi:hypothetical protein
MYPKVAVYDGHGSTDDAANFRCSKPRHAGNDNDDSQGDNDRHDNNGDDDDGD